MIFFGVIINAFPCTLDTWDLHTFTAFACSAPISIKENITWLHRMLLFFFMLGLQLAYSRNYTLEVDAPCIVSSDSLTKRNMWSWRCRITGQFFLNVLPNFQKIKYSFIFNLFSSFYFSEVITTKEEHSFYASLSETSHFSAMAIFGCWSRFGINSFTL